jgi:hypothetical protein
MVERSWLVGLALLVGCGGEPAAMHGDTTFTLEERAQVEVGNAWIAGKLGREAMPIVWDRDPASSTTDLAIVRGAPPGFDGYAKSQASFTVWIDPRPTTAPVEAVAAHEFGHLYGCEHSDRGVMHPGAPVLEFTPADEAACPR